MREPIKPALTKEEWELRPLGDAGWSKTVPIIQVIRDGSSVEGWPQPDGRMAMSIAEPEDSTASIPEELKHAVAALALYNQPFGFTREHVVLLQKILDGRDDWMWEDLVHVRALIVALLPPEKES